MLACKWQSGVICTDTALSGFQNECKGSSSSMHFSHSGGLFEVSQTWLVLPVTSLFPKATSCSECCTALQKLQCGSGNGNSEAENKSKSSIASIRLLQMDINSGRHSVAFEDLFEN